MSRRHRFRIAQLPVSAVPAGMAAGASVVTGVGRSTRVGSGTAAGVASVSGIAPGGDTGVLLASNFDAASPYGFDLWNTGDPDWYTLTKIAGGSPSGHDSMRCTWIQTSELGNASWGGAWGTSLPNSPAQGTVWYVRFRIKYTSPMNWRSDTNASNQYEANNRTAPDKLFILGNNTNNCPNPGDSFSRIIAHQYALGPSRNTKLPEPSIDVLRIWKT